MPDLQPMAPPQKPMPKRAVQAGLGAAALSALALAVASLPADEGKRNVGYLDIASVPTACFGHTGKDAIVGQRYSDDQCRVMLTKDARDKLNAIIRCTPGLAVRPYQLGASIRLAFNIGAPGFCGSTAARRFNAGDWRGGCDAFLRWNRARVNGRIVVVKGLADRRARERAMCLEGV